MQRIYNIKANTTYNLQKRMQPKIQQALKNNITWFTEISSPIPIRDSTTNVNDFDRQPLLIAELSHNSPCMVKYDINGDSLEDIIMVDQVDCNTNLFAGKEWGIQAKKISQRLKMIKLSKMLILLYLMPTVTNMRIFTLPAVVMACLKQMIHYCKTGFI